MSIEMLAEGHSDIVKRTQAFQKLMDVNTVYRTRVVPKIAGVGEWLMALMNWTAFNDLFTLVVKNGQRMKSWHPDGNNSRTLRDDGWQYGDITIPCTRDFIAFKLRANLVDGNFVLSDKGRRQIHVRIDMELTDENGWLTHKY